MPNFVDGTRAQYESMFNDCFALEELYLPNAIYLPDILVTDATNPDYPNELSLKYIYAPKAIYTNRRLQNGFSLCHKLEWAYLPNIQYITTITTKWNATLYLSEKTELINGSNYDYSSTTIVAPEGSYAAEWAKENGTKYIPSDYRDESVDNPINVTDLGRSICTSVAGLRFGFTWNNIDEIENLATDIEYGFIYSQQGAEDLSMDTVDGTTVKKAVANNHINHGDNTSFNLVISNIPAAYYSREITARAYVCIDGMYFYSNVLKGSFNEVAGLVLADNEIDTNTKNAVKNLLEV